jgi:crossover junction endodeoxyribonuclease RusA
MVLSKEARVYRQLVRQCVRSAGMQVAMGPLAVRLDLYPPDRRRRDCDNAQKPILDALQQAGAFVDDSQIVWLLTTKGEPVPDGKVIVHIHSLKDGIPWQNNHHPTTEDKA